MESSNSHRYLSLLVVITVLISNCGGELRFCHNGPQRMTDSDCPGGFVFKTAFTPGCKYFAKDNGTKTVKEIILTAPTDVCDDDSVRVIESAGDDFADMESFTWFTWDEDEEPATNNTTEFGGGVFTPENVCIDECFGDWRDQKVIPDEDPIPDDWDHSTETPEHKKYCRETNSKLIFKLLIDKSDPDDELPWEGLGSAPYGPPSPPPSTTEYVPAQLQTPKPLNTSDDLDPRKRPPFHVKPNEIRLNSLGSSLVATTQYDTSKMNLVKLLAKSMQIAISACAPFVNEDFFEQVLKGMIFISKRLEGDAVDLGRDLYKQIFKRLDHCGLRRHQEFVLNGTKCECMERVDGIYYTKKKEYWPYRLTGRSFRWGKYHPLLDAAWMILDFAHSFCFESFLDNFMYMHAFEVAMEGLFPKNISLLWRLELCVKNDKFWNNFMQTCDLNVTMRNLDACATGARIQSPYMNPLPRPFLTLDELRRPAPPAPPPPPPTGWTKPVDKYWEYYESHGGFKELSKEFGKCFQESDSVEMDVMIEVLKEEKPC